MKKKLIVIALLVAFGATIFYLQSCSKIASLVAKNINIKFTDVTMKIAPISDTTTNTTLGSAVLAMSLDSLIKAETGGTFSASNINSAKLSVCNLSLNNYDSSNNFANFQSASFNFSSNSSTASAVIASIPNNPNTFSTSLSLPVDSTQELKGYLNGSTFYYSLSGKMRKATTDTLSVNVHIEYNISLK